MSDKKKANGAIWKKSGQYGEYLSGQVELSNGEKVNFKAYLNNYKQAEKHPDYRIFLDQPKVQQPMTEDDTPF